MVKPLVTQGVLRIQLNGRPVQVGAPPGIVDGGTLAANFAVRDKLGVDAQANLDAVARYDIDTGVDADYDLRSDLEEDANQFIRSWRLHVRSTFLPEWVRFRESDGNMT